MTEISVEKRTRPSRTHGAAKFRNANEFRFGRHARLALTVVALARDLENAGSRFVEEGHGDRQIVLGLDSRIGRGGHADARQESFFRNAVLRDFGGADGGANASVASRNLERFGGHVLELEGNDVAGLRERLERVLVAIG